MTEQPLARKPEVYARYFQILTHRHLQERRDAGLPVSSAHGENHLRGVSSLIPAIGEAYGFSEKEIVLGRFVAQFHDIVRSGREDLGLQDETESAQKAQEVLDQIDKKGSFLVSTEEREAISFAIINHGKTPSHFKDPLTREGTPVDLKDRLHTMVYVADGLQKLGAPLIHRRSAFVGGERRLEGDLKDMRYEGREIDAIDAILLESAVRLGWKNVEGMYPVRLRRFIQPAFEIQREWVTGLLVVKRMDVGDWAEVLWNTRNSDGKNIFELSKLPDVPKSMDDIIDRLEAAGKITEFEIMDALNDPDLVASSVEAAVYFSQGYQDDSAELVKAWAPEGEYAKMWKKGM